MVQLKSYYSLCPLIDRKSFIGVTEDVEAGCGIVTLGKNVVTRYKFSDQKQFGGWTSKDHITAPVVFDTEDNQYVGIFNEYIVKVWDGDVTTLDKLKKNKFSKPIYKIIRDEQRKCTLIFKDGDCASLPYALDARKNLENVSIIGKDETIVDVAIFTLEEKNHISYITKIDEKYTILTCELNIDINSPVIETIKKVDVAREEFTHGRIVGVTISATSEPPQVHILWSDGRLFSNNLTEGTFTLVGHVPWICPEVDVSLAWMGGKHIVLYGADAAQDGAVLAVFNVLFGVGTCSHPLKLFCKGARLWCLREHILLEATQHLAVVPFLLSTHRNMLALVGSYKNDEETSKVFMADWGKGKTQWKSKDKWNELATKGMSEREICLEYFPSLLEESNIVSIKKALKEFTDIPENIIVNLISHVIQKLSKESSLESTDDNFSLELNYDKLELRNLLNSILDLPYVKENMISCLRKSFVLEDMLFLLRYINFLLFDKSESTNFTSEYEDKIISWSTILLDSHYQQLVFSNEKVTQNILRDFNSTVESLIGQLQCVENVIPLLSAICAGKDINDNLFVNDNSSYYIEEIKIKGF